uniref:Uncharacterized protein n=1 Tax=Streptomyces ambofaciens (strain ATCC 23877 / 3486 / DSM 40053 / JCM 4204 / NBRC 12836 / NRRL B-2516) TaxID=278992 RepID=A0ACT5_STRA7|nr:hypothetical protein SAMR0580 [Streptomyces ambofaciens ATCC 23877]
MSRRPTEVTVVPSDSARRRRGGDGGAVGHPSRGPRRADGDLAE